MLDPVERRPIVEQGCASRNRQDQVEASLQRVPPMEITEIESDETLASRCRGLRLQAGGQRVGPSPRQLGLRVSIVDLDPVDGRSRP
jgi:hypothetical protein